MPRDEIRTRAAQELCKRFDLFRYLANRSFEPAPGRRFHRTSDANFFFSPNDLPEIVVALRKYMPDECARIIEYAEQICGGEFDLLGLKKLSFGSPINWHLDPVRDKSAPHRIWYRVPYMNPDEIGDSKVIWELNRHQHLVTLAKAYCLTGEGRFVQEIFYEWDTWHHDNPYPIGVNWASSLEVGFRALSWLWVWHLLKDSAVHANDFKQRLWRSLAVHGRHIEMYLSTYSSPNTHLLGEVVALFFLGVLCPELHRSAIWKETGWRFIQQESKRQVLPDGMHFEQSTYYHVYALDFFLHARILAARNGIEIPAELDDALQRMLEWLSIVGQSCAIPRFGDDDGGRLFDGRRNRGEHLLDPLSTGAILFQCPDWKAVVGSIREETMWLLGPDAVSKFENLKCSNAHVESRFFSASGTCVMTEGGDLPHQLTLDAGPQGVFSSGHGHADALSVHLSIDGREWLVDPGTFSYLPGQNDREAFRGTPAHNTLLVDGQSQAIPLGPFTWKDLPQVTAESWVSNEKFESFEGHHNGYSRLSQPVIHCRSVFHLRPDLWLFHDSALGEGSHHLEVLWHFSPEITLKERSANACVFADADGRQLGLLIAGDESGSVDVRDAWYSPVYADKLPAKMLRCSQIVSLPSSFGTLIIPCLGTMGHLGKFDRISQEGQPFGVTTYRYATQDKTHQWTFAKEGQHWQVGSLASDARVLYCCFLNDGRLDRWLLSDGTFVRLSQEFLFESSEKVLSYEWQAQSASLHR